MSEKGYRRLVLAIFVTGIVLTLAHLCYIIYAYKQCSVIYFIAEELW
ncbi:MAG: hypothetical protein K6B39_01130 [Lachnospiraceae bacterium]|nr:hypothetical protein [Lachnospiraceae bacterium]